MMHIDWLKSEKSCFFPPIISSSLGPVFVDRESVTFVKFSKRSLTRKDFQLLVYMINQTLGEFLFFLN